MEYKVKWNSEAWNFLNMYGLSDQTTKHIGHGNSYHYDWMCISIKNKWYAYCDEDQIEENFGDLKEITTFELKELLNSVNQYAYVMNGFGYKSPEDEGWTRIRSKAEVFTLEEAIEIAEDHGRSCDVVLINVEEHNKMILNEIEELKSRIIKL